MTRRRTAAALLAGGALVARLATAATSPAPSWRASPLWDDGRAEFAAYAVTWARYGNHYPGRALLVLVKESWAPELDVKADRPRRDGFDVLKLNHLRDVRTGIYTYHQMASVFLRRDDGRLRKLAATSSEACGVSTALVRDGRLETHSYFDGADPDRELPWPAGALPEDGLPATLRDLVTGELPATVEVFPALMNGRFAELVPARWELRRTAREVEVPAGRFAAVELRLERDGAWQRYAFAAAAPHPLLELERSDGTHYRLAKLERLRYWEQHDPGGERWWPEALRDPAFGRPAD